jgi:hypothetical protein
MEVNYKNKATILMLYKRLESKYDDKQ